MRIKSGNQRGEILLFPASLEQFIEEDNIVRLIDAFVDVLHIADFGIVLKSKGKHDPGAPQYAPEDLLKLYIYGYLNRSSSSRQLAKLCRVNIEVMWLIKGLQPGHVTINNFRKDNPKGLKKIFRSYNRFLDSQELFGKQTIGIDGSKFRAQNAKRHNHTQRSLEQKEHYLEKKYQEYLDLLDKTDKEENDQLNKAQIQKRLEQLADRKKHCKALQDKLAILKQDGETQISTVDPDARKMRMPNNGMDVCTNIQSAVDDKHCLVADFTVTNKDDKNALSEIAIKVKQEFKVDSLDVLADAGYFTASELKKCSDASIVTYVSPHENMKGKYSKEAFNYNAQNDTYTCPGGQLLTTNGKWSVRKGKQRFKKYSCSIFVCEKCPFAKECISVSRLKTRHGKTIERMEYDEYVEANKKRIKDNKTYYRRRAEIVEHPFGTIKRSWGYSYSRLKGLKKIEGEFSLIFLCYNIRRSVSIMGVKHIIAALKAIKNDFWACLGLFYGIIGLLRRNSKRIIGSRA